MRTSLCLVMLLPLLAVAQTPPAFDPSKMPSGAGMQTMMQQAQKMAACMADIDQAKLEALGKEAQAMSDEIEALCATGNEDEALSKAIAFSRKMQDEPTIIQARECTKGMGEMMSQVMPSIIDEAESRAEKGGICD